MMGALLSLLLPSTSSLEMTPGACCFGCGLIEGTISWIVDGGCECVNHTEVKDCSTSPRPSALNGKCKHSSKFSLGKKVKGSVFGVHTGHVGSRSLGKGACILADEISFVFEYDQIYNDSSYPWDSNGMNMWYADSKRGSAMHLLETTILPNYLLLSKPNQHLIVDFGHNLNLGFLRPLAAVLGDRVAFVRVVRHRYDTCRSFMSEGKVPCGKGMWTLCPTKHPHIALPPPRGVWNGLTPWQKVMWFIDEVEARWQRLLADFPDIDRLLVHWCDGLDFERARFAVFDFFGQRAAAAVGSERKINVVAKKCKQGKHTDPSLKSLLSDAELGVQDADYQALMAYDNHTLSFTLRNVLRPFDCGYQK